MPRTQFSSRVLALALPIAVGTYFSVEPTPTAALEVEPPVQPISASSTSVVLLPSSPSATVQTVSGSVGTPRVTSSDASKCAAAPAAPDSVNGEGLTVSTFVVTGKSAGRCTLTFRDAHGTTATVEVAVARVLGHTTLSVKAGAADGSHVPLYLAAVSAPAATDANRLPCTFRVCEGTLVSESIGTADVGRTFTFPASAVPSFTDGAIVASAGNRENKTALIADARGWGALLPEDGCADRADDRACTVVALQVAIESFAPIGTLTRFRAPAVWVRTGVTVLGY